jgi:hypothetical protein
VLALMAVWNMCKFIRFGHHRGFTAVPVVVIEHDGSIMKGNIPAPFIGQIKNISLQPEPHAGAVSRSFRWARKNFSAAAALPSTPSPEAITLARKQHTQKQATLSSSVLASLPTVSVTKFPDSAAPTFPIKGKAAAVTKTKAAAETKAKAKAAAETNAKTAAETKTAAVAKAKAKAAAEIKTKARAAAETKTRATAETKAAANTKARVAAKAVGDGGNANILLPWESKIPQFAWEKWLKIEHAGFVKAGPQASRAVCPSTNNNLTPPRIAASTEQQQQHTQRTNKNNSDEKYVVVNSWGGFGNCLLPIISAW